MVVELALLLGAAQLRTGNADLDCILDRVPAAERVRIAGEVARGEPAASHNTEVLVEAVRACVEQHSWDAAFAQSVTALAASVISGEESRTLLERAGIDPRLVDQWFDAQSESVRTNVDIQEADVNRLFDALGSSGVAAATLEGQAGLIGNYLGALIIIERVGRGLPLS